MYKPSVAENDAFLTVIESIEEQIMDLAIRIRSGALPRISNANP